MGGRGTIRSFFRVQGLTKHIFDRRYQPWHLSPPRHGYCSFGSGSVRTPETYSHPDRLEHKVRKSISPDRTDQNRYPRRDAEERGTSLVKRTWGLTEPKQIRTPLRSDSRKTDSRKAATHSCTSGSSPLVTLRFNIHAKNK